MRGWNIKRFCLISLSWRIECAFHQCRMIRRWEFSCSYIEIGQTGVVQSSWITALTQQTGPCGGTERFLKCTFQGGLPLHQPHLVWEAVTKFSQLQWRLIFDPFAFHCMSWALNHCCAEQLHSASPLEFHPLKKIVLYLDLDLLLWILHFSPLLSRIFFHNKPKFHRTEYLGR